MLKEHYPTVRYLQGKEQTCLFSSFASALAYLHLDKPAEAIAEKAPEYAATSLKATRSWVALVNLMKQHCRWLQHVNIKTSQFDILHNISKYPTVVALEATDGGTQHAITVVGKLVFDSNCQKALPLNKATLDYCCSSDESKSTFMRVLKGIRFQETKKDPTLEKIAKKHRIDFF